MQKALGGLFTVLKNKYYVDELYQTVFIKPAIWISEVFTSIWMDKIVIDGFLHGIARLFLNIGTVVRQYFDIPVINRGGDAVASGVSKTGGLATKMQSGQVQQYLVSALAGILVMVILILGLLFFLSQMAK